MATHILTTERQTERYRGAFSDGFYEGIVPPLDSDEATKLARFVVMAGVDNGLSKDKKPSDNEQAAASARVVRLQNALSFTVTARLVERDGGRMTYVSYCADQPDTVGLVVADNRMNDPMMLTQNWISRGGLYRPEEPVYTGSKPPLDVKDYARDEYSTLYSRIGSSLLEVVSVNLSVHP